jgi:hypothetical protein
MSLLLCSRHSDRTLEKAQEKGEKLYSHMNAGVVGESS